MQENAVLRAMKIAVRYLQAPALPSNCQEGIPALLPISYKLCNNKQVVIPQFPHRRDLRTKYTIMPGIQ